MTTTVQQTDMAALKSRLQTTWSAGDYDRFSRYLAGSARDYFERLDIPPGSKVLDVGCGSGQLALLAARDGVNITGVDIASNLIQRARDRAAAMRLQVDFQEADAEALPFADGTFDFVYSLIGAMFAPRPAMVADEMLRVCAPGGTIAMGNWTKEGFIGKMLATVAQFVAPPGMPSPMLWGDEAIVRERFGPGVADLTMTRRYYMFDYPFPPSEVVAMFRECYGPTNRAFASLDQQGQHGLAHELVQLFTRHNRSTDGCTFVEAEYLEVTASRVTGEWSAVSAQPLAARELYRGDLVSK